MKRGKKGQVTIFIIIGIIIVVLGLLFYAFYPEISSTLGFSVDNPSAFLQSCLEDDLNLAVEKISKQGGAVEPEFYYEYLGEKIQYLCYTNEYYKTCTMQVPMLEKHIEEEILREIQPRKEECLRELEKSYTRKGYSVNLEEGDMSLDLVPNNLILDLDNKLTLTKEETQTYDRFNVVLDNNLFELLGITNSILNYEARYGDSETTFYMDMYHDIKVEKKIQSDGTTVYIISERDSENKFQFASRSMPWPPGYA